MLQSLKCTSNEAWRRVSKVLEDVLPSQLDAPVRGLTTSPLLNAYTAQEPC